MKRVISMATIGMLLVALNVTGVLAAFYRVLDNTFTLSGTTYNQNGGYGYGYGQDENGVYGYGYGYDFVEASSGGGSSSGGSSSGGSSSSHGGSSSSSSSSNHHSSSHNTSNNDNKNTSKEKSEKNSEQTDSNTEDSKKAIAKSILGGKIIIKDGVAIMNGCKFPIKKHTFLDDDKTFASKYIALLQRLGIVNGKDGNGKIFAPESNTTRFEFIKMTERVFCLDYSDVDTSNLPYTDVKKGTWQARVAQEALNAGLVTSKNSKFRGNDNISRIEAFKVLTLAAKMNVIPTNETVFTDVKVNWMKKYAEAVRKAGIANGQMINGKLVLEPTRTITRAESAKVIVKAIWAK